nr:hypothetical protein [Planctomycetota bacterium]
MRPVPPILRASIALLLLGLAVPIALRIDVEAGNDAWIDPSGAAWNDLQRIEERFGRSDGFVIALFAADVLAPDALAWQRRVVDAVRILPGVEQVTALVDARDVAIVDGDIEAVPLLPRGVRAGGAWLPGQRERILQHPLYSGLLVSASGDVGAIVVEPSLGLDERGLSHLQDRLTELSRAAAPAGEVLIAGLPAQKRAISRAVNADQRITVPLIFAVLLVFLAFFLRDARLVLIAALAVPTALAWTYAVINAVGHPLDAVLGLLPPLVMGTTVITSLHLLNGHAETIIAGGHRVRSTLRRVAVPLSLTTLATLAGMIGLWWGAVPAVRSFAEFAAAGILAAVAAPILWLWALGPWLDQG